VFYILEQIRIHGLVSWRYQELQDIGALQFQFADRSRPLANVFALVQSMSGPIASNFLQREYEYSDFDEKLIRQSLAALNHDNLLVILTAPEVKPFNLGHIAPVAYNLYHEVAPVLDLKLAAKQAMSLSDRNTFIPRRLAVKSTSMLEDAATQGVQPQLILANKTSRVWFAQGQEFRQPQALVALEIKSPLAAASPSGAAQSELFAALINDQLAEFIYPARSAGVEYKFCSTRRGYDLQLYGFSDRQSLVLSKIADAITVAKFTPERFESIKAKLIRERANRLALSERALARTVSQLMRDPAWSDEQILRALEATKFDSFVRFASHQLLDARMDMLVYGNYFRSEALKLAVLVEHQLLERQTGREMPPEKLITLGVGDRPFMFDAPALADTKNEVALWIPAQSLALDEVARMLLVQRMLEYLAVANAPVSVLPLSITGQAIPDSPLPGLVLMVSSNGEENPRALLGEWLQSQAEKLPNIFAVIRNQVRERLLQPHLSWKSQADYYWFLIRDQRANFSLSEQLIQALDRVTSDSLAEYYQHLVMTPNTQLWVDAKKRESAEESTDSNNFQMLGRLDDFKRTQPGFYLP